MTAAEKLRPRFLPDRHSAREWGGKGAALAKLIRKGYPVPPTAALGLSEVQGWLESFPEHSPAIRAWRAWSSDAPELLRALQEAIRSAPMPDHWKLSANTLRKLLCGDEEDEAEPWPMILRSSMSAEDGSKESFAGCYESVRVENTTPEGLWDGITRVVASAFAAQAAERVLAAGVDPARFRAGVVIQPCLVAELAGVCFSRDPVDPWSADGTVEWVRGAGEALVQGTGAAGRRRWSEGPSTETAPFWEALWKRARAAERLVGGPADLEWVWDGEQLWFVQARAIATEEARLAARAPRRKWTRELTLERFPEPMTPMGWSALEPTFEVNLRTLDRRFGVVARSPGEVAVSVRGVIYSDPKFFAFPEGVRIRWGRYLHPFRKAPWLALGALLRFVGRGFGAREGAPSRALLKLDVTSALLGEQADAIRASWVAHCEAGARRLKGFGRDRSKPLLGRMDELLAAGAEFMEPDLAVFLVKDSIHKALAGLWRSLGLDEHRFADLFRSFDGNRTLEMNRDWGEAVAAVAADEAAGRFLEALSAARSAEAGTAAAQALGEPARKAWTRFLERNGHSTTTWDIATPIWSEDPSRLAPLLEAAVQASRANRARSVARSGLREESRRLLLSTLEERGFAGAASRVQAAIDRLEAFMRMDEEHHFLSGLLLAPSRRLVLEGGEELANAGVLERGEDAFFVTLSELRSALEAPGSRMSLAPLARRRRSEWERALRAQAPFELPQARRSAEAEALESEEGAEEARHWQGAPMSPGVVTGRAIVAEHLDQVRGVEPGSILVTTSPNPALTPLYPLLGGLVSVTGSSLSHGFVSAREYGLPAVSGIARATERIPSGAMIRVDGGTGRVEVIA